MIINGDWKNKVRTMRANGDNEGAKRELRKAKMMCYDKLKKDKDKIFIDYCLAHYAYKESNFNMANEYMSYIGEIFNTDEQKISEMNLEYCNYLWLKVNINYENMKNETIVKNMTEVYEYYMEIGKKDIAISALINIFCFEGNQDRIIDNLERLLKCDKISDWNFVESILIDCEKISHNLYIKAMDVVNKNNNNIDIDVV